SELPEHQPQPVGTAAGSRGGPPLSGPTVPTEVMPGAEPFAFPGGDGPDGRTGVLLVHGFTGTPMSMRPWGEHLAAEGFAVRCPLLPGHGTRWQDCNQVDEDAWVGEAEQ